ncbi:MAG TPA: hypothetical protein VMI33_23470 [Streptosporangiaceae bacterium]|nr:hypothetical protein [Streptosporangiaceae bacterium]
MELAAPASSPRTAVIRGLFLAESLKTGSAIGGHDMRLVRCSRYQAGGVAAYQPPVWTAIEFEAPGASAAALADELSENLLSPGWYVNWSSDTETTIVFPGKIFRYRRGDREGRAAAQEHGRSCGVPEPQLDWTE